VSGFNSLPGKNKSLIFRIVTTRAAESFRDPNFERRNATLPFCGQEPKILP